MIETFVEIKFSPKMNGCHLTVSVIELNSETIAEKTHSKERKIMALPLCVEYLLCLTTIQS